jgi:hypothetical protein
LIKLDTFLICTLILGSYRWLGQWQPVLLLEETGVPGENH